MKDGEDSDSQQPTSTPRQDMEDLLDHYKSYIIEPGDEDLPNYRPQKLQSAEAVVDRMTVLANLEFVRNTGNPESWAPMLAEMKNTCWFIASEDEQEIMEEQGFSVDSYDRAVLYRFALYGMLWALGEVDDLIASPGSIPDFYPRLKEMIANPEKVKQTATLRSAAEILQARADTYKVYMEFKLNFDAGNEEGNMGLKLLVSAGCLVAMSWLVDESDWDDILYTVFERTFLESTAENKNEENNADDNAGYEGGMRVVSDD